METSTLACRPFNLHLTPGLTLTSENKRGSFRRNPSWPESTSFLERSKSPLSFQAQIFTSCLSIFVKELKVSPAYDPNSKGTSCRPSWSQIIHTRCPFQKTVLQESNLLHQKKVVQLYSENLSRKTSASKAFAADTKNDLKKSLQHQRASATEAFCSKKLRLHQRPSRNL